jgi:hypothetical protein
MKESVVVHHGVTWVAFHSRFADAFWPAVAAALVAGAILVFITYKVLERNLHLAERQERRQEALRAALRVVRNELKDDLRQARLLLRYASERAVPYPLFDVNGWTVISQPEVMVALDAETFGLLTATYNRLRTANESYAFVYDLHWGPTSVNVVTQVQIAHASGVPQAVDSGAQFDAHRSEQFDRLVDRVNELRPIMGDAVIAVRRELAALE